MASQTKAKGAAALQEAGISRKSFSVPEFCARNGISEGFYRKLRARGLGPDETRILDRIVITDDDEANWLRQRKADTNTTEPA
jgi:hypothetical protein